MKINQILGVVILLGACSVLLLRWLTKFQNGVGIFGALKAEKFSETLFFGAVAVSFVFFNLQLGTT